MDITLTMLIPLKLEEFMNGYGPFEAQLEPEKVHIISFFSTILIYTKTIQFKIV